MGENLFTFSFFFVTYFLAGLILTRFSIWISKRLNLFSVPNERSSHTTPTPRIGGIGIAISVLIFLLFWLLMGKGDSSFFAAAFLGSFIAFTTGLVDDVKNMKFYIKLFLQILCAVIIIGFGWRLDFINIFWGNIITLFWVLLVMNGFNFMDGMDGQAGIFSLSVFLLMLIATYSFSDFFSLSLLLLLLIGCTFGFLIFNFPPAKTFLGDCGSQFLGFVIAFLSIYIVNVTQGSVPFLALVIILLPFLYDVIYTIIRRIKRGENILLAHRSHLYQRLMITGMTHRQVLKRVVFTYLLCFVFSILYIKSSDLLRLLLVFLSGATMFLYTKYVIYKEKTS